MRLSEKQAIFTRLVARLILRAEVLGYDLTFGEAYRPPELSRLYAEQGRGIEYSLHSERLGIDFNLFRDGAYLKHSEDWKELGEWWEQQSIRHNGEVLVCCWGGRFGDGNHFSIKHGGRA